MTTITRSAEMYRVDVSINMAHYMTNADRSSAIVVIQPTRTMYLNRSELFTSPDPNVVSAEQRFMTMLNEDLGNGIVRVNQE